MKNGLLLLMGSVAVAPLFVCRSGSAQEAGAELAAADAAVRRADAEWAALAGTAGVDAWMAHYGADAIVMLPNDQPANGKELIRRNVAQFLAAPHFSLAWHPVKVEVALSGELAHLDAAYEFRYADPRGALKSDRGKLEEIWKKQTDGSWKCIVDTWKPDDSAGGTPHAAFLQPAPAAGPEIDAANSVTPAPAPAPVYTDPKYGAMPSHYEEAIRQYFQDHLKDPDSVQYQEIRRPERGFTKGVTGAILMSETRNYGWTVKATIDARNSGGSRVGSTYTFLFRGEKIVHVLAPLSAAELT